MTYTEMREKEHLAAKEIANELKELSSLYESCDNIDLKALKKMLNSLVKKTDTAIKYFKEN